VPYSLSTTEGQSLLASLRSSNELPVSNVYSLSPDNLEFSPSGAITMRYDDAALGGLDEATLGLYGFSADGSSLMRLPYLTLNTEKNELTARVPGSAYLFAVLASSIQAENVPVYDDYEDSDWTPPETNGQ